MLCPIMTVDLEDAKVGAAVIVVVVSLLCCNYSRAWPCTPLQETASVPCGGGRGNSQAGNRI